MITFETVDSALSHWSRNLAKFELATDDETFEYTSGMQMFWGSAPITSIKVSRGGFVQMKSPDGIGGTVFNATFEHCGRFWNQLTTSPLKIEA